MLFLFNNLKNNAMSFQSKDIIFDLSIFFQQSGLFFSNYIFLVQMVSTFIFFYFCYCHIFLIKIFLLTLNFIFFHSFIFFFYYFGIIQFFFKLLFIIRIIWVNFLWFLSRILKLILLILKLVLSISFFSSFASILLLLGITLMYFSSGIFFFL